MLCLRRPVTLKYQRLKCSFLKALRSRVVLWGLKHRPCARACMPWCSTSTPRGSCRRSRRVPCRTATDHRISVVVMLKLQEFNVQRHRIWQKIYRGTCITVEYVLLHFHPTRVWISLYIATDFKIIPGLEQGGGTISPKRGTRLACGRPRVRRRPARYRASAFPSNPSSWPFWECPAVAVGDYSPLSLS